MGSRGRLGSGARERSMQNKPDATAPNKPNFGPGKMKGKCCANKGLRQVGCGSGPGKTKPIRSGGGYQGQGSAARVPAPELRASCTNKPNSDRGHVRGKSCRGKELWFIIHAEGFGKTKPISIRRGGRLLRCTANAQHLVFLASIFGCGRRLPQARNDMGGRSRRMTLRLPCTRRGC